MECIVSHGPVIKKASKQTNKTLNRSGLSIYQRAPLSNQLPIEFPAADYHTLNPENSQFSTHITNLIVSTLWEIMLKPFLKQVIKVYRKMADFNPKTKSMIAM